ncbi:hypothetical protein Bbelb_066410 [Branchiostoma belcheri]|nr:hypothetical protein Bbelb_066410 [Branchiostoma belcheri]
MSGHVTNPSYFISFVKRGDREKVAGLAYNPSPAATWEAHAWQLAIDAARAGGSTSGGTSMSRQVEGKTNTALKASHPRVRPRGVLGVMANRLDARSTLQAKQPRPACPGMKCSLLRFPAAYTTEQISCRRLCKPYIYLEMITYPPPGLPHSGAQEHLHNMWLVQPQNIGQQGAKPNPLKMSPATIRGIL